MFVCVCVWEREKENLYLKNLRRLRCPPDIPFVNTGKGNKSKKLLDKICATPVPIFVCWHSTRPIAVITASTYIYTHIWEQKETNWLKTQPLSRRASRLKYPHDILAAKVIVSRTVDVPMKTSSCSMYAVSWRNDFSSRGHPFTRIEPLVMFCREDTRSAN